VKRLSLDPAAEEELRAIVARYEMQQQGLGAQFFVEVGRVLELLLRRPRIGSVVPRVRAVYGVRRFYFDTSRTSWCIASGVQIFT
jgi:plasmid stabilization system protein ParE